MPLAPQRVQVRLPEVVAEWTDRLQAARLVVVVRLLVREPARVRGLARARELVGPRELVRLAFARPGTQRLQPRVARALGPQALELARARRSQEYTST